MARCNNCGSNDADVDWGLCYECFCNENDRSGGALSNIAATNYQNMGMSGSAHNCRVDALNRSGIKKIKDYLEKHPEKILDVQRMLSI